MINFLGILHNFKAKYVLILKYNSLLKLMKLKI